MKAKYLLLFLFISCVARSQSFKELSDSLLYYYQQYKFKEAIPFAEKVVVIVKERYGTENNVYAKYLKLLSGLYVSDFRFTKAEETLVEMNAVNKKLAGDNNKDYIDGIGVLAVVYSTMGNDSKAVPLFVEAMNYYKKVSGDSDPEYATAANRLAKVYENLGEYDKAVPIFLRSIEILAKTKGVDDLSYATSLNNLGTVYKNMGHTEKAEPLMLRAMEVRKKTAGEESGDLANSFNNLAVLYSSLGQHRKAEDYYQKAANIFKKTKGAGSAEFITSLTNLGSEYDELGDYAKAEQTLLEAMAIVEKEFDENWPERIQVTKTLGQLYLSMEQYDKAEPLLLKVTLAEEAKNNSSEPYAANLNNLAFLYAHTNRVKEAESMYLRSAELTKLTRGDLHNSYAATLDNLSVLYQRQMRYPEALSLLITANKIKEFNLLNLFAILSEQEKANYMATNIFLQHSNLSLLYNYRAAPGSFYRENYNIQLLVKSLLLADSKNVLEAIRSSSDSLVKDRLSQWQKDKIALSKEYALPETKRSAGLKQLEDETENLEKELVRLSAGFRNMRSGIGVTMEDVQKKLGNDEAAIEFVSFRYFNKEITDSIMYAAFILKKNDSVPVFVSLFEEKELLQLTGKAGNTSKVFVNNLYPGTMKNNKDSLTISRQLYQLIWQPLEPSLKGIKKISYSPAGKLYNIAFHALAADSASLLMDHYQLYQYTSTRELAWRDTINTYKKPTNAFLLGNPSFSLDSIQLSRIKNKIGGKEEESTTLYSPDNNEMNAGWENLQGTEIEINQLKKLFALNKISTNVYIKEDASEENIKALNGRSPELLFIATHGFFLQEKKNNKNISASYGRNVLTSSVDPLLRSGLILSGGNYAWSGKPPIGGIEDGIVTAYEIAQLDLGNTKLAVLSACETALGDIKGTEGVFGLQRALKMAGVKKMIVSLWKVPDKETSELMLAFYSYWLGGQTINAAFMRAQNDMRKKYPPYYWAAFVLVE